MHAFKSSFYSNIYRKSLSIARNSSYRYTVINKPTVKATIFNFYTYIPLDFHPTSALHARNLSALPRKFTIICAMHAHALITS